MSAETSIEQRLKALEVAVAELQRRLSAATPAADWLEQITGSFKDHISILQQQSGRSSPTPYRACVPTKSSTGGQDGGRHDERPAL
jgi:hypothetical protein